MSNETWYAGESWYAPLQSKPEPAEKTNEKKKKSGWRTAFWCTLILLVLVGSSLLFREVPSAPVKSEAPAATPRQPSQEEEMPDDWRAFFRNYYEAADSSAAKVDIDRVKVSDSDKLSAQTASGGELSLQELYRKCSPSVVGISAFTGASLSYSWGSGVILSEDGLILTNTHVLDGTDRAVVTLYDDSEYEARLVGADSISDLALLKIETTGLPAAEFGRSDALTVGEHVAAIGNPLGEGFRMTMTDGIISAIDRDVSYKGHTMTLLQTNTALNEGNSGGPLFNLYGQVVGVTNMKMMSSGSSIEGIGFAIPSNTAVSVVNALIADGEVRGRPAIGITVGAIPAQAAETYNMPEGLYISAVSKGSDAEAKGLREGDVLMEINGRPVTTTTEVAAIRDQFSVGDSLRFKIWRDGEIFEVDVRIMEMNDVYG